MKQKIRSLLTQSANVNQRRQLTTLYPPFGTSSLCCAMGPFLLCFVFMSCLPNEELLAADFLGIAFSFYLVGLREFLVDELL